MISSALNSPKLCLIQILEEILVVSRRFKKNHSIMGVKRCHGVDYKLPIRIAESKERLHGMRVLLRKKLGFNNLEFFLKNSAKMGRTSEMQGKEEALVVEEIMKKKIRDRHCLDWIETNHMSKVTFSFSSSRIKHN